MFKFAFYSKVIFIIFISALITSCSSSSSDNTNNTNVNAAVINFGNEIVVGNNSTSPQEILLGDIDNDGDLDIVAINQGKANVGN